MSHRTPKRPLISVIMPVLNDGAHVARAVESVLNQDFGDLELVVVDGGSKDRTRSICERFAERDIRVDVYGAEDGSLAAMRNCGLDHARGSYVLFCEGAGWLAPHALEQMAERAQEAAADLVLAGVYCDVPQGDKGEIRTFAVSPRIDGALGREEFRSDVFNLIDSKLLDTLGGALFSRARIEEKGLRFRSEDAPTGAAFVFAFVRDVARVGLLAVPLHHFPCPPLPGAGDVYQPELYAQSQGEYDQLVDLLAYWGMDRDKRALDVVRHRYLEQLAACIVNVCSKACTLSSIEKRERIRDMISSAATRQSSELNLPRGSSARGFAGPIRKGNVGRVYMEGCLRNMLQGVPNPFGSRAIR